MSRRAAVILAAGQGTRMRSPRPKVLHPVGGRSMLDRAIDAAEALDCEKVIVVAGAHSPEVARHAAGRLGEAAVAIQDPPLGTGHAVLAAQPLLQGFAGDVVVTYADAPLVDREVIEPLFAGRGPEAALMVLGFEAIDPTPYGRLIFGHGGGLAKIVEAKDASPEERMVRVCNSGVLAGASELLFELLSQVTNNNAKGEYYLTDVVELAGRRGLRVGVSLAPESKVLGVNSQGELALAERAFQAERRIAALESGVTMTAPETVFFSWDTLIEPGVTIEPNVIFASGVSVRRGAVIRAFSHLEGAIIGEGALIGPFARLRPGADIGAGAHIGNFVEVKKVSVGQGAKANHLAYLGDGSVGAGANIGAGTIFCNYDGFDKFRTEVGERAFVGSNSALVAPVKVGAGAYVGSGSVITKEVSANALALGRGVQVEKPGWAEHFRASKKQRPVK